jgi:type VI secretion system protein ImpF
LISRISPKCGAASSITASLFQGNLSATSIGETLAREIKQVLVTFEPRLKESGTKVSVTLGDKTQGLRIDIDAVLIMSPTPERMKRAP